jgi:hypothetical protein
MGEAKRRNKGGEFVSNLLVVRSREVPRILAAAAVDGDRQAMLILQGLGKAFSQIKEKGGTSKSVLCATCDHAFGAEELPGPVVLQIPWGIEHTGEAGDMIVSACCKACGAMNDAALSKSVLKMIRTYAPDTRVLDMEEPARSEQ